MAIVEDEPAAAETLRGMIERYRQENTPANEYRCEVFSDADFLMKKETYDVHRRLRSNGCSRG